MEPLIPIEASREETPTRRRRQQPFLLHLLYASNLPFFQLRRIVVLVREGPIDEGVAIEVAYTTEEVGGDFLGESEVRGGGVGG